MKASKLIDILDKLIKKSGDQDVKVHDGGPRVSDVVGIKEMTGYYLLHDYETPPPPQGT